MNWFLCGLGFSGAKNVYFVTVFTAFGENGKHFFLFSCGIYGVGNAGALLL